MAVPEALDLYYLGRDETPVINIDCGEAPLWEDFSDCVMITPQTACWKRAFELSGAPHRLGWMWQEPQASIPTIAPANLMNFGPDGSPMMPLIPGQAFPSFTQKCLTRNAPYPETMIAMIISVIMRIRLKSNGDAEVPGLVPLKY